jgi:hypothetical protein
MASARLKPRTNIAHVRECTKRQSPAARGVHDRTERGGGLSVFGTALFVLVAVGLAVITGFMA